MALLAANLIWSGSYAFARLALAEVTPLELVWFRTALASAVLLPLAARVAPARLGGADRLPAFALGLVGFALSFALEYSGIRLARASNAALFVALEPLGIVVAGALLFRERIGPTRGAAIALALSGVALLSTGGDGGGGAGSGLSTGRLVAGNALLFGTLLCQVTYTIAGKRLLERYAPIALTAYSVAAAAAVLTPAALIDALRGAGTLWPSPPVWGAIAYLGLGSTVLGYLIWNAVLGRFDASFLALFLYVQPVSGVLIAWALVGERPTPVFVAGAALILSAVWLTTRAEKTAAPPAASSAQSSRGR